MTHHSRDQVRQRKALHTEAVQIQHDIIDTTISDLLTLKEHIVVAGDVCNDCWSNLVHDLTHDMEAISHVLSHYTPEAETQEAHGPATGEEIGELLVDYFSRLYGNTPAA